MMKQRVYESELMDLGPAYYSDEEYRDCLRQLDQVGRFFGGDSTTLKAFRKIKDPTSILDVGCGGGHFTARLAHHYPHAQVVGLDISAEAIAFAKEQKSPINVEFCLASEPELNFPPQSFDVVTATLVCHHLNDQDLISFLQQAAATAKKAVIINDLHRHPLAWIGFSAVAFFFFRNRLILHDGPLSVRRAFTKREWISFLHQAKIPLDRCTITWRWPFRWVVEIDTQGREDGG